MKTGANNKPFTGAEYENENDRAYYYIDGYLVARLHFDRDVFSLEDELFPEETQDMFYEEMTIAKSRWMYNAKMN